MTDPRLIHGTDAVAFVVLDEVAYTPQELRAAVKRPKATADSKALTKLLAAADALQQTALALPKAVLTYELRAALAQYRTARKGIKEE